MTCEACQAAEANPHCGQYRADCLECAARMLSHSPAYFEAKQSGKMTPAYRQALASTFGEDWQAGHERVKAWAKRRMGG